MYGHALSHRPGSARFRVRDDAGRVRLLDAALDRWLGECDDADRTVLDRCSGATTPVAGLIRHQLRAELLT